jgi:hypothetical protein
MVRATGTFEITSVDEEIVRDAGGEPKLTRARGAQRFTGDIDGDGQVEWCCCYLPSGSARLIGLQRVEGTLAGRHGSFVVEAVSDHDGRQSRGAWTVVPGSGTGELAGIAGSGGFEAPGGPAASYWLDHDLD